MPAVKKKAASKKPVKCDCVSNANAQLAPQGLELDDRIVMSFAKDSAQGGVESPIVKLRWIDAKKKKPTPPMFCAYCPFCGRKKS